MNELITQEIVPFHGTDIITYTENAQTFIAMKPICETFGIQWQAQFNRLKRDEIFNSTISIMDIVGADEKQREMVCLRLEMFPMWLAKIQTDRIQSPEARELVKEYQLEAAEVLFNHFFITRHRAKELEAIQLYPVQKEVIEAQRSVIELQRALLAPKPKRRPPRPFTDEEKQELMRLHRADLSSNEIAERLNRSGSAVAYWIRILESNMVYEVPDTIGKNKVPIKPNDNGTQS